MPITKLTKHDTHFIRIHLTKPECKHYAALRCVTCNKHIQWLSKEDADQLLNWGVPINRITERALEL